jgi:thioredoxin-like negative regulator of GroEL
LAEDPKDSSLLSALSVAEAGAGRKEEALRQARRLVELFPISRDAVDGVRWEGELAQINAWVGESEAALDQLAKLVKMPGGPNYGELRFNPVWDSIRTNPRFQEIMAQAAKPLEYD